MNIDMEEINIKYNKGAPTSDQILSMGGESILVIWEDRCINFILCLKGVTDYLLKDDDGGLYVFDSIQEIKYWIPVVDLIPHT